MSHSGLPKRVPGRALDELRGRTPDDPLWPTEDPDPVPSSAKASAQFFSEARRARRVPDSAQLRTHHT